MSVAQLVDLPVEVFGGRNTSMPPSNLPPGSSSFSQDVEFPEGAVRTRAGLEAVFPAPLPSLGTVNGLKTYPTPSFLNRLMCWDALGNLYRYDDAGALTLILGGNIPGLLFHSATQFGREYMAFYAGNTGGDIPRQYDDTNFDRVSQVGPGQAPQAADEAVSFTIAASPNGAEPFTPDVLVWISEVGNVVTVEPTVASLGFYRVGQVFLIAGCVAGFAPYNGTWTCTALDPSGYPQFVCPTIGLPAGNAGGAATIAPGLELITTTAPTGFSPDRLVTVAGVTVAGYNIVAGTLVQVAAAVAYVYNPAAFGLAASGAGTLSAAGIITVGLRGLSVAFITRQGYITAPAPPKFWMAGGARRVIVSGIPLGPANIVARLLLFTLAITPPATTGKFYSLLPLMYIEDNTTTSVTLDFLDAVLAAGFSADYLFGQQELGECVSVGAYNSRLVWLGERAKLPNFLNLTFDGGWNLGGGLGGSDVPLGWTSDPADGARGERSIANSPWLDHYVIRGTAAAPPLQGMITQSAYQDYLAVAILRLDTSYSYRVRLSRSAGLVRGNFAIEIYSASLGSLGLATVPYSAMPIATWMEFTGLLMAAQPTIPADALLRVYASDIPTFGEVIRIDSVEIFPTLNAVNASNARVSYANNPEGYDGVTGNIGIRPNDGQTLRAQFPIRNNYYLAKDNYLCYVVDDGVNEPASWAVNEVSATIGICGPNAVDWTEEWAVLAHRSGVYVCMGSDPIKISQEIQEDATNTGQVCWNSINWLYAHTIWVRIDALNKRILIGAPVEGATSPNVIFVMDYKFAATPDHISAGPGVVYSVFSGRLITHGGARRWTIWNITSPCCTFAERPDGTAQDFYGGVNDGEIYNRPVGNYFDRGRAISSFWFTSAIPSADQEQAFQLRSHRKLFGYLTGRVTGSAALPGAVSSMIQTGPGYVRVVMTVAHGLVVGDWVIVSGASDPTYNGYRQVLGVPDGFTFVYAAVTTLPAAVGATVTGTLNVSVISTTRLQRVRGVQLNPDPVVDFERQLNFHAERFVVGLGTTVPGGNFQLEKLICSMMPDSTMPIRGAGL